MINILDERLRLHLATVARPRYARWGSVGLVEVRTAIREQLSELGLRWLQPCRSAASELHHAR